ncbi:MAG: helix-turn-helix transcriptional regulator [Syntrophomonadaceae bacterium]|jgi:transcriptional regulator with XRE-family HTH domain|nr:helix-turn-helix transcriptional regulator [Syntrophomonadaceae bacterium]
MGRPRIKVLGERLQQILDKKKMQQKDLAETIGQKPSSISNYITGNSSPPIDVLGDICRALNISADYLLGLTDIPIELEHTTGPIENEILMIRRSYTAMSERERMGVLQLVRHLAGIIDD